MNPRSSRPKYCILPRSQAYQYDEPVGTFNNRFVESEEPDIPRGQKQTEGLSDISAKPVLKKERRARAPAVAVVKSDSVA